MGYLIGFLPFRCGRPLSSGSQLSRFGCASRVSSLPLFPKESAALRCKALVVIERMVCSTSVLIGVKKFFYFIDYLIGFVPFRCGHLLSSGRVLSRFGCASRISSFPLFP
ncbi:hypothetical protein NDQ53_16285 [Rossellomorea marisflavi]|uniref:hypothetical protein n=1 Tax=Rossellomorea marisflavi TaxID=189381 RepID=UPI00203C9EDE|nr:hypothetical protein [Rossellomorea marisflavi]MCM2590861.1 hypothetical protein [Rossellomorea marisflavi]